jgi:mannose-6-phosphate isomerase-like protein (cupin superfamily)
MSGARQVLRSAPKLTAEQEPFLAVRSLATDYASGYRIERHHHPWHQFLYAVTGAMTVTIEGSSWTVPTGRSVFIPESCPHAIRMWGTVEMRTLYFSPAFSSYQDTECRVMEVAPLLRELILRTVDRMGLDSRSAHDARLIGLLEDEIRTGLKEAANSPLSLPMPRDQRARVVADFVLRTLG